MKTCHLKEPSIPFATVTSVTLNLDDGTTLPDAANAAIGITAVDGRLLSAEEFADKYEVDAGPLA